MSNILVTGGAGFIGTNLIKTLLKQGANLNRGDKNRHKIVSLDNYSTGTKDNHQLGCEYFNADIARVPDYSFFMAEPQIIFHIAARARIQPSLTDPYLSIFNNILSTLNILEFSRKHNSKVIFASSSSVHGGKYKNPYAWTKDAGEELCILYAKLYDVNVSIARFYNVYGDYMIEGGEFSTVLGTWKKQYKEGKPITVTGDGKQRRDFTHVDDIVKGLILLIKERDAGTIYEFGKGKNFSVLELAKLFKREIEYLPRPPGEVESTLRHDDAESIANGLKIGWTAGKSVKTFITNFIEGEK